MSGYLYHTMLCTAAMMLTRTNPSTCFTILHHSVRPRNFSSSATYMVDSRENSMATASYQKYRQKFESLIEQSEKLVEEHEQDRLDIAVKAQSLFDDMIEKYVEEDDSSLKPALDIYNILLKIYALAPVIDNDDDDKETDPNHDYEEMTRLVLKRMEEAEDSSLPKPDVISYLNVMDGWFHTKRYQQVISLFDQLIERSKKDASLEPDTRLHNILIRAWMKSGDINAPNEVENYLNNMIRSFTQGNKSCRPTFDTFVFVMETFIRNNVKFCDAKVRHIIERMTDLQTTYDECEDLVVNTIIRNIEIKALGQRKDKDAISEIERVFQEMIAASRNGNIKLKPDGATFVNIMNSLKNNPTFASENRVNSLLALANQMYETGELTHDANLYRIYNAALVTIARSKSDRKADKAKNLLDQMKELKMSGKDCFSPDVRSYNSVLNACAYTKGNKSSKDSALRIAVSTFNDLRGSTELEPNHVSYGTFLQVAGNLMEPSELQDKLIETVFKKCRAEGHVSVFVLQSLTDAASPQLCASLLGGDVEGENGVSIPSEWSRNCEMDHVD